MLRENPTFSIIIPMKNAAKYINTALNSIAEQQFKDFQILVIDDNSDYTDISKYLVTSWKIHHPNIDIKLFKTSKGNGGPGGARNVGIDNASGKYIIFLDADDKLNNNALLSIKKSIDDNPQTDIFVLGNQLTRLDNTEQELSTLNLPAGKLQESRFIQVGANFIGQVWNLCIKKSIFGEKDDIDKIRFKPNCKFEDLPTKVNLFVRNKKDIKSVPAITHTQYSRPVQSITGTLSIHDLNRLREVHYEIANLKNDSNTSLRDKIYLDARKVSMLPCYGWLIQKAIRNKLDKYKKQLKEEKQTLKDEIILGM